MQLLKALCSAQFATIVDFAVTVLLSSFLGVYYVIATTIGAVTGGVTNCMTNYRWVFPGSNRKKVDLAVRYTLVWCVSMGLNVLGTYALTEMLRNSSFVQTVFLNHTDQVYIIAKLVVAIAVAVTWNYQMQKMFVYSKVHSHEL